MLTLLKTKLTDFVEEVYEFLFGDEEEDVFTPKHKPQHTRDCTPLNQYHYDFILAAYEEFSAYNQYRSRPDKKPVSELTERLNERFGLNKSTRSYQRIWAGQVKREDLPQGQLNFEW